MFGSTPGCSAAFGGVLVVPGVVSVSRSPSAAPSPSSSIPSRVGLDRVAFKRQSFWGNYKEKIRYKKCSLCLGYHLNPNFLLVQKPPTKNPRRRFFFPFHKFTFLWSDIIIAHGTTVAKSRGGKSEKQREAPRERKKVFSVSFPFFSFFFFFFVVGKSFLEQREKTFSALEKKIWCWRLW